jgi:hypothetical protein
LKAQVDENLPPALARALHAIVFVDGHAVEHVKDYAEGARDLELFEMALARGITVHITQDHHQRRGAEKEAIAKLGLTVFVLASGWNNIDYYRKAAWLIEWWPKMVQAAQVTAPGSIFIVPASAARNGRLKQYVPRR